MVCHHRFNATAWLLLFPVNMYTADCTRTQPWPTKSRFPCNYISTASLPLLVFIRVLFPVGMPGGRIHRWTYCWTFINALISLLWTYFCTAVHMFLYVIRPRGHTAIVLKLKWPFASIWSLIAYLLSCGRHNSKGHGAKSRGFILRGKNEDTSWQNDL